MLIESSESSEWTLGRLRALVENKAQESLILEFKGSDALGKTRAKREDLAKDVSAFANAAGGTIIYGMREINGTSTAGRLDEGADQTEIPPEWIQQVVESNIQPKLNGLRVIAVPAESSDSSHVYYVVSVPQGSTAYMSPDNKYYKRTTAGNAPMQDYEVRDTMARDLVPRLQVELDTNQVLDSPLTIDVTCYLTNEAVTPAEWCVVQLIFPSPLVILQNGGANDSQQTQADNGWPVTTLIYQYGGFGKIPLWQGLRVRISPLSNSPIRVLAAETGPVTLGWRLTAPRMGWRNGQVPVVFS